MMQTEENNKCQKKKLHVEMKTGETILTVERAMMVKSQMRVMEKAKVQKL